jgi:Bacterial regulatory proteins, luxR family
VSRPGWPRLAAWFAWLADDATLFVEQSTVKTHLIHLYSKLGIHSRAQAVARAPRLLG